MTHAQKEERLCRMLQWLYPGAIASFALSLTGLVQLPAIAQVTLDGSLGSGGALVGPDYIVPQTAGRAAGSNLFHSFGQFNIAPTESVTFESDATVRNILARVTGGRSTIEGLIATQSRAVNLFLMNPNGIIFGRGARLNVGGSFVATTASEIWFGNQGRFSALPASGEDVSLLTIDPSALRFNQAVSQPIAPISMTFQQNAIFGVPNGQSLLLAGGNLTLTGDGTSNVVGGTLQALGGRVELTALAGDATLDLLRANGNDLRFGVPEGVARGNISLNGRTLVNVAAGGGGYITLYANNIDLLNRSNLIAGLAVNQGFAGSQAGDIRVDATGSLRINNNSQINNEVAQTAIGSGGNILINVGRTFSLDSNGIRVRANTNSQRSECDAQPCNAGSILIRAGVLDLDSARIQVNAGSRFGNAGTIRFEIAGNANVTDNARIESRVLPISNSEGRRVVRGNSGNIILSAQSLTLQRGGRISTNTDADGAGGSIQITAPQFVNITGRRDGRSTISAEAEDGARQAGGNIEITTDYLQVQDGALVNASTRGRVDAGSITFNTPRLEVITGGVVTATAESNARGSAGSIQINAEGGTVLVNGRRYNDNSAITVDTEERSIRQGGNITIDADLLQVQERAEVSAINEGGAASGSITVNVNRLELTRGGRIIARTDGQGDAGNIIVNANGGAILISGRTTDNLARTAGLFVNTRDAGDAGNIQINDAGQIVVENNGFISAATGSDIADRPRNAVTGRGGSIAIAAQQVQVQNGGEIRVSSEGIGSAGNLTINAPSILLLNNGDINAETFSSSGGNITLNGVNTLQIINSSMSASTRQGIGGSLNINAAGGAIALIGDSDLSVAAFRAGGSAGNLDITAERLTLQNGARIAATNLSSVVPNTGNITINGLETLVVVNSQISASTATGQAGSLSIAADTVRLRGVGGLAVEATDGGIAGSLAIATTRLFAQDGARVTVSSTAQGSAGSLRVTARDVVLDNRAGLTAETIGGSGGDIRLRILNSLRLTGGSDISASTVSGNGGNLIINAGGSASQRQQVDLRPTNLIRLSRSSRLSARATGTGNAGNVAIVVRQLILDDLPGVPEPAGIFASSISGVGGDITLQRIEELNLNNSRISASTQRGRGGSLEIEGSSGIMTLSGTGGLFVEATETGSAGNIEVTTRQLTLNNRARISAANRSFLPDTNAVRNFGNIRLQGLETLTLNNSQITASTRTGRAGSLIVNTGRLDVTDGASITVSGRRGQAGDLTVTANQIRLDQGELDAETGATGTNQANIQLRGLNLLVLRNGSQISARAFNNSDGGNVEIDAGGGYVIAVPNENSDIIADAAGDGNGGDINITTQSIIGLIETDSTEPRSNPISEINASSEFGLDGNIIINTPGIEPGQGLLELPADVVDASRLIAQGCSAGNTTADAQSEFVVTGRGGLPPNPEQPLQRDAVIADWVSLDPSNARSNSAVAPGVAAEASVVEAQGWTVNADGQVLLTAHAPPSNSFCHLR
ncbi:MAG: S-layer family protein [Oculatellaceae cyanobacterium bins.114]|nr:S-layer family protein [Oculatellaceae cyanobacterium bins.114]